MLDLAITPALRGLLQRGASDTGLPEASDVRAAAAAAGTGGSVRWDLVKALAAHERQHDGDAAPTLQQLCRGSGLAFPAPPKPQGKPPELQRRLDELRAALEQQQYDRMVSDVTQHERRAAAAAQGGLATYRQQMSFGLHVLAMMAAFYAFGHVAGVALGTGPGVRPFVGLTFMVGALLLESTLYILRTNAPPKLHAAATARATAARVAEQQEQLRHEGGAVAAGSATAVATAGGSGSRKVKQKAPGEKKAD